MRGLPSLRALDEDGGGRAAVAPLAGAASRRTCAAGLTGWRSACAR